MPDRTDALVREEGIQALIQALGHVDAERFVALLSRDSFDYTKWRQTHLEADISVRELSRRAQAYSLGQQEC